MTVIVGMWDEVAGEAFLGSDSQVTTGSVKFFDAPKVHLVQGIGFGFSGPLRRMQAALRFLQASQDVFGSKEILERVILATCQHVDYTCPASEDAEEDLWWVVATPWGIASVATGSILWRREMAEGSGQQFALGSLHATAKFAGVTPEERVRYAIEAACKYDTGCGLPLQLLRVGAP